MKPPLVLILMDLQSLDFTIRNVPQLGAAIYCSDSVSGLIKNNVIYSVFYGILLWETSNIKILDNHITEAVAPIHLINAANTIVRNNDVSARKSEEDPGLVRGRNSHV